MGTDTVLGRIPILIITTVVEELESLLCYDLAIVNHLFGADSVLLLLISLTDFAMQVTNPSVLVLLDTRLLTEVLVEEAKARGYDLPIWPKDLLEVEEV